MATWMLYGANGYTGQLMLEEAQRRGEMPIVAGRRQEAIAPLASRYGLEMRVFDLDSPENVAEQLEGIDAIALAAGPFSATSAVVVEACLRSKTHYTDITGEIAVFEACRARDEEAREAGVVVLPGVGFDVVPTDCLAASLSAKLPGGRELILAFRGGSSSSQGTTKSMIEALPHGGKVRRDGEIVEVPSAHATRRIPFRDRPREAVAIPWGDVSTAHASTGIPNIEVFMAAPESQVRAMRLMRHAAPVLALDGVQRGLKKLVELTVRGPDAETRDRGRSQIYGKVTHADGRCVEGTLVTPEGYALTAKTAVDATVRCAKGEAKPGFKTPSLAFGADYITTFEDCDLEIGEVR